MENSPAARFGIGFNVVFGMFNAFLFFQLNRIEAQLQIQDERIHLAESVTAGLNASIASIATTVGRNTDIVKKLDQYTADPDRHRMEAVETRCRELEIRLERLLPNSQPKSGGP